MDQRLADLLQQLELERLEVNLFRGESRDIGSPQVFGGQVLGQALMAAYSTIEGRVVHSLHAYFLRRGDFNQPIVYQVDRSRDGQSFSSRRVIAIQHGEQIFTFSASFQEPEDGLDHQVDMPEVPPPESLADSRLPPADVLERLPEKVRQFLTRERPFELRRVEPIDVYQSSAAAPLQNVWLRAVDRLPDDDRAAPLPAGLRVGLQPARDRDAAACRRRARRRPDHGEHRPRDVVPPSVPRRRMAAVFDGQPQRVRRARFHARQRLHPRRQAGRQHGAGGPDAGGAEGTVRCAVAGAARAAARAQRCRARPHRDAVHGM